MQVPAAAAYATLAWVALRLILHRQSGRSALATILKLLVLMLLMTLPVVVPTLLFVVLVSVLLVTLIDQILMSVFKDPALGRTVATLVTVPLILILFSDVRVTPGFNQPVRYLFEHLSRGNRVMASITEEGLASAMLFLTGALLSACEANHVVIYVLRRMQLGPSAPQPQYQLFADRDKGRGKVIGYLERAIVFSLVYSGNLGGIGFVLTAKALARFRELDTREFAEYVLIGTLVSVAAAAFIGALFGALRV
ncbi:MAG: hypothetical protein EA403_15040 [Spirochaetaceae bacterium]|nr:MAG: hypothetical protein EA403_15040 [Spirochaetaceae bacterium]